MNAHPEDETQELPVGHGHNVNPAGDVSVGEFLVPRKNPVALTAYYLAIFSLVPGLGLILGPFAFVLGIQGMCQAVLAPEKRGGHHAAFSVVLSLITTIFNWVLLILLAVGFFLFMPPREE